MFVYLRCEANNKHNMGSYCRNIVVRRIPKNNNKNRRLVLEHRRKNIQESHLPSRKRIEI